MIRVLETSLPSRERDVGWQRRQAPTALLKLKPVQSNPNPCHAYLRPKFKIILPSMHNFSIHIYTLKHFMHLKKKNFVRAAHSIDLNILGLVPPNKVCWIYKLQSSSFRNSLFHSRHILSCPYKSTFRTSFWNLSNLKRFAFDPRSVHVDLWWTKWHRDRFLFRGLPSCRVTTSLQFQQNYVYKWSCQLRASLNNAQLTSPIPLKRNTTFQPIHSDKSG